MLRQAAVVSIQVISLAIFFNLKQLCLCLKIIILNSFCLCSLCPSSLCGVCVHFERTELLGMMEFLLPPFAQFSKFLFSVLDSGWSVFLFCSHEKIDVIVELQRFFPVKLYVFHSFEQYSCYFGMR